MQVKFRFVAEAVVEGDNWEEICKNYYAVVNEAKSTNNLSFDKTIGVINNEEWEDLWDEYFSCDYCAE